MAISRNTVVTDDIGRRIHWEELRSAH